MNYLGVVATVFQASNYCSYCAELILENQQHSLALICLCFSQYLVVDRITYLWIGGACRDGEFVDRRKTEKFKRKILDF
jgi:hypothetical protein